MDHLKALIVDANKASRKNLVTIVKHGVGIKEVKLVENAQYGINYLKQDSAIDIVFVDLETISKNLFKFIVAVKKLTNNPDVKFVLLATSASKEFLIEAASKGISALILKPYIYNTVVVKVKKVFSPKEKVVHKKNRLSLLEAVSVELIHKEKTLKGALVDISDIGCSIKMDCLQKVGLDIYSKCIIQVPMEKGYASLKGVLIRMEREGPAEEKKISAAFEFCKFNGTELVEFEKLWSLLLSYNTSK